MTLVVITGSNSYCLQSDRFHEPPWGFPPIWITIRDLRHQLKKSEGGTFRERKYNKILMFLTWEQNSTQLSICYRLKNADPRCLIEELDYTSFHWEITCSYYYPRQVVNYNCITLVIHYKYTTSTTQNHRERQCLWIW